MLLNRYLMQNSRSSFTLSLKRDTFHPKLIFLISQQPCSCHCKYGFKGRQNLYWINWRSISSIFSSQRDNRLGTVYYHAYPSVGTINYNLLTCLVLLFLLSTGGLDGAKGFRSAISTIAEKPCGWLVVLVLPQIPGQFVGPAECLFVRWWKSFPIASSHLGQVRLPRWNPLGEVT